jgi:hypothetical protein
MPCVVLLEGRSSTTDHAPLFVGAAGHLGVRVLHPVPRPRLPRLPEPPRREAAPGPRRHRRDAAGPGPADRVPQRPPRDQGPARAARRRRLQLHAAPPARHRRSGERDPPLGAGARLVGRAAPRLALLAQGAQAGRARVHARLRHDDAAVRARAVHGRSAALVAALPGQRGAGVGLPVELLHGECANYCGLHRAR